MPLNISAIIPLVAVVSLFVGILGGCIGAYVTMKVGVAVLESRMTRAESDISDIQSLQHDDLAKFSAEIRTIGTEIARQTSEKFSELSRRIDQMTRDRRSNADRD